MHQGERSEFRTRAEMIDAGLSLDEQNESLLALLARLKMQIEGASADAAATGDYSDRGWFNRAKYAYRMLAVEHQTCLRELGDRNKSKKRADTNGFGQRFIDTAKRRLDPLLFASLMAEAHECDTSDGDHERE